MTPFVTYRNSVAVLNLGDGENRFSLDWIDAVDRLLIDILASPARALVTTATGKFYSNGLDLEWLLSQHDRITWYIDRVQSLLSQLLTFPLPTAAAINGHAFGAGAMFAIAHDYRVMRSDRGYFCFPEVDIRIPFTTGMAALIQAKLSPQMAIDAMTTGHRYGGIDSCTAGLVQCAATEDEVTDAAIKYVESLAGKDPGTLAAIKATMFASVVATLSQTQWHTP